jgi:DNA primase
MKTWQDIKSAAYIDAIVHYAETLLGIRFTRIRAYRHNAPCPFHADTKENFVVYLNKKDDEVRFHCFGACKGDWDIYDVIMLRQKCRFTKAQQVWAEYLKIEDFKSDDGHSPSIPEPDETPAPEDTVGFVEPQKLDAQALAVLADAAGFYNDLLMSNRVQFKHIWEYLARRGIEKDTVGKFNIGYAPPYSDAQHHGRALITKLLPRFKSDDGVFRAFSDGGLVRFLNDASASGYGYYCRQIDFRRKDPFSRNYGDFFAGRIVFPIFDADARPAGVVGRRPGDRGVRWLKHQAREVPLSATGWLYGLDKAAQYIHKYRTIILVEGLFDYFAFYNLLQDQNIPVVVSTLGSYLTPEAANSLKGLGIEHFIVAYDWDELGRNGIERFAVKSGGWVYYLGGLTAGQAPYDMLEPVISTIGGFSLKCPETNNDS